MAKIEQENENLRFPAVRVFDLETAIKQIIKYLETKEQEPKSVRIYCKLCCFYHRWTEGWATGYDDECRAPQNRKNPVDPSKLTDSPDKINRQGNCPWYNNGIAQIDKKPTLFEQIFGTSKNKI